MSSIDKRNQDKRYWRSLDELANTPEYREFLEGEFPPEHDRAVDTMSRRRWLQLMSASVAFGAVAGCRWEKEEIRPFVNRPEGRVPGKPQFYATAYDVSGIARGLRITTIDGRPLKVEGNPEHPQSLGATDVMTQATILEFYDPDRSAKVLSHQNGRQTVSDWKAADAALQDVVRSTQSTGDGLAILAAPDSSPTQARLKQQLLKKLPKASWFEYAPVSDDNMRAGSRLAFNTVVRSQLKVDQADVILCLDDDLLSTHPTAIRNAREFAKRRDPDAGKMNRLYVVESGFTITGASADHRLPLQSSRIADFAGALEAAVTAGQSEAAGDSKAERFLHAVAADLVEHRGTCLVTAGANQPAEVHAAVHRMNQTLGNVGKTVFYTADPDPDRPLHIDAMRALVKQINAGSVKALLILGGNPVYDAPADLDFGTALASVPTSFHLSVYNDETSRASTWHLPQTHFLECWADARAFDGTYSVVQPTILPLYEGRSAIQVLATLVGEADADVLKQVRTTFQAIAGDDEAVWRKTLHDGLLAGSQDKPVSVQAGGAALKAGSLADTQVGNGRLELVFQPDASVYDGRFANNGWLQEVPDPMTKIAWDNAALLSPATARELGVENQTIVTLTGAGRSLDVVAFVLPGQARGSISLALGFGRSAAGYVGGDVARDVAPVGANAYQLRTSTARDIVTDVTLTPTGRRFALATSQDHHSIDTVGMKGRAERVGHLIREASVEHYREHPDFVDHVGHTPPLKSLWNEHPYEGHRWGLSIDLSKCTGCNACVVACQAENNIPIVGKEQVMKGREMHWIRLDRYFEGDPEDPNVARQPVACHQCELAPCEQVCPVNATSHSREGLNDMAYNRCIGTRYCANNCPYKVRRFNFFNYHKNLNDPANDVAKLKFNPEVTIRHRGVMEKCTYCTQRIEAVKIEAKNAGRPIADGEIKTACQQVCPSQAIVFGDLADSNAEVTKNQAADRSYAMLAELNIKPRTQYLARIRNPNPALESDSPESNDHEHNSHHG